MKAFVTTIAAATLGMAPVLATSAVKADPAIGVAVVAPITPLTLGVATGVAVVANEAFAKKPFGPNGEGMKAATAVVNAPVAIVKHWFPHW